jgi:ATP-dependent exoDNAse (exonuclease V) beta subunit
MIVFDEKSHTYTNTETGNRYISVTTLLGKYKKPFDSDTHSKRVAEREGVSQAFVLESWKETTKIATDKGTKIHNMMEQFVKFGETVESYNYLFKSYNKVVENVIGEYKKIHSEKLLALDEYEVAGMSDLIYERKDDFIVADFKTNKKYRFNTDFNDYMLTPVEHLSYCEFNSYALQLSLYAYMFERETGKKCSKIVTFYLNEDRWVPYHSNYLKTDILNILNDYRVNQQKVAL